MSYNTALSGLNAAQSDLGVISNNIANVQTVGFKGSRAEFADIYASSTFGAGSNTIGSGVLLSNVSQQFHQGNLEFTENTLDLAISGEGFFAMKPDLDSEDIVYTRAGQFGVNPSGFIVNSAGNFLQGFPANADGTSTSTALASTIPLQLPSSSGSPSATTEVDWEVNLSPDSELVLNPIDRTNPAQTLPPDTDQYNWSTSAKVYDSQGNPHTITTYYMKTADNVWDVYAAIDVGTTDQQWLDFNGGNASATFEFDQSGQIRPVGDPANPPAYPAASVTTATVLDTINLTNGAAPLDITLDYAGTEQISGSSRLDGLNQDGYTTGRLSGLEITDTGLVRANYTNGQSIAVGKVALVQFENPQGLNQLGNTMWSESINSGEPLAGEAGTGQFGLVKSGAVETSNVDLTEQLVKLITAQRNFQANAKSIETFNAVTQTIIQLR